MSRYDQAKSPEQDEAALEFNIESLLKNSGLSQDRIKAVLERMIKKSNVDSSPRQNAEKTDAQKLKGITVISVQHLTNDLRNLTGTGKLEHNLGSGIWKDLQQIRLGAVKLEQTGVWPKELLTSQMGDLSFNEALNILARVEEFVSSNWPADQKRNAQTDAEEAELRERYK